jgi:hypothetical protein
MISPFSPLSIIPSVQKVSKVRVKEPKPDAMSMQSSEKFSGQTKM